MLKLSGSMSTNTGVALTRDTAMAVETNEMAGTITSSPGPMPAALSAISSVTVPFMADMPCRHCVKAANSRSSRWTKSLCPPQRPLSSTSRSSVISRSVEMGQSGICIYIPCRK